MGSHLIWCPQRRQRRKPVLVESGAARCRDLLEGKCAEKGWERLALALQPDHRPLFVRVWPSDSAAEVVKACQGITSFHLRTAYPQLRKLPSRWTRSYFASTAVSVSRETIQRSIDAQTRREESRPCARPTRRNDGQRLRKSAWWTKCSGAAVRSTTAPSSSASRGGGAGTAGVSPASSRKPNGRPSARPSRSTPPAIPTSCKTCWPGWTGPIRRFFRRVAAGEQPGVPRYQGRTRYHAFTYKEYGNGARRDNGALVLAKSGRSA